VAAFRLTLASGRAGGHCARGAGAIWGFKLNSRFAKSPLFRGRGVELEICRHRRPAGAGSAGGKTLFNFEESGRRGRSFTKRGHKTDLHPPVTHSSKLVVGWVREGRRPL